MRALRWTGNVFIVLGATLLFFVVYEVYGTSMISRNHQSALAESFDPVIEPPSPPPTVESPSPSPSPSLSTLPLNPGGPEPIARIRIPRIGVNQIVVEGVTLDDLSWGPGHYRLTPQPGEPGSVGIAGHRTGWGSPFINLDKLERGHRIHLDTPEATYVYEVTGSRVVDPGQSRVLLGDPRSRATHKLTLTTCTPKYTSLRRLIVWADQVDVVERT